MRLLPVLPALLALAACSTPEPTPAQKTAFAASAMPTDPHLAELYTASCKTCHGNPASGAPLVGDATAWAPRVAQGPDALFANIIAGKNAMPAGGQCYACTPADYRGLIAFLSKPAP
jgi:cytochrome c5